MRETAAVALLACWAAAAASALDFGPQGTDIDIRGVIGGDAVLAADRTGAVFGCDLSWDGNAIAPRNCRPLRHVDEATLASLASARREARETLGAVSRVMADAVRAQALEAVGCRIEITPEAEEAALRRLAVAAAPAQSIDPVLPDTELVEVFGEVLEDGAELLQDQGRLQLNEDRGAAVLTDCP